MYSFFSLLVGMLIAIMITINGELSGAFGVFLAAVIIHVVGSVFAFLMMTLTREKLTFRKKLPLWFYLGGILGVVTTFCNNFAFGKISLTSIIALVLLGQTITSLMIDTFGFMGMKRYPFKMYKLIGLSFAALGILMMMDAPSLNGIIAIILSIVAGVTVVLSRTCNAKLAEHIGVLQGSFMNHMIGLPVCLLLLMCFDSNLLLNLGELAMPSLWVYTGGVLGVVCVLMFNILVPRVAAFPLTLLSFVGQLFTSMLVDLILFKTYDFSTVLAGLTIAVGISINMILDYKVDAKQIN